jgi:riboflavin-specific deaminase-like protein
MSAPEESVELTPLYDLDGAARAVCDPVSAAAVVERLRLWEPWPSAPAERPRMLLNMACTADGRATIGGRSGPIGNRADRELFHALRTAVDAVLVGAGTARAERYRRLVRDADARRLRGTRGLHEEPLACIVSGSLALPPEEVPLLSDSAARVAILTASSAMLPASAATVEYVRCTHAGSLDLAGALRELRQRLGVRTVLCEGGPHLNAELLGAGLVDELWLSFAPKLAGGSESSGNGDGKLGRNPPEGPLRILSGPELDPPVELDLLGVLESESQLLLRYRVAAPGAAR